MWKKDVSSQSVAKPDQDKWDQVIYENANKTHLHQDNIRWTLLAGFGVFFLSGISIINDPKFKVANSMLLHYVQYFLFVSGTIWFVVLVVEGWYYNLFRAYLVDCE